MAPPTTSSSERAGGVVVERGAAVEGKRDEDDCDVLDRSQDDKSLISDLLEQHGSPCNPTDQCKTLEQVMLDSERDICIFAGALDLLAKQLELAKEGGRCSVCMRDFDCASDQENCTQQIDVKSRETELARDESRVVKIYNTTKRALSQFQQLRSGDKKFESRVSFNMRSGALTELRNQKAECLQELRCFACQRGFDGADVTTFLQRVDRNAYQMQERLHVHSN